MKSIRILLGAFRFFYGNPKPRAGKRRRASDGKRRLGDPRVLRARFRGQDAQRVVFAHGARAGKIDGAVSRLCAAEREHGADMLFRQVVSSVEHPDGPGPDGARRVGDRLRGRGHGRKSFRIEPQRLVVLAQPLKRGLRMGKRLRVDAQQRGHGLVPEDVAGRRILRVGRVLDIAFPPGGKICKDLPAGKREDRAQQRQAAGQRPHGRDAESRGAGPARQVKERGLQRVGRVVRDREMCRAACRRRFAERPVAQLSRRTLDAPAVEVLEHPDVAAHEGDAVPRAERLAEARVPLRLRAAQSMLHMHGGDGYAERPQNQQQRGRIRAAGEAGDGDGIGRQPVFAVKGGCTPLGRFHYAPSCRVSTEPKRVNCPCHFSGIVSVEPWRFLAMMSSALSFCADSLL